MQLFSAHRDNVIMPAQTIRALPPDPTMPYGTLDTVLAQDWQHDSSAGTRPAQVRLIFKIKPPHGQALPLLCSHISSTLRVSKQSSAEMKKGEKSKDVENCKRGRNVIGPRGDKMESCEWKNVYTDCEPNTSNAHRQTSEPPPDTLPSRFHSSALSLQSRVAIAFRRSVTIGFGGNSRVWGRQCARVEYGNLV
ncbi:hypothetical protein SERLADRAFT_441830 [Serpula lacrymans var. lacrymans S7.9]|uniref:Uncharacterized protein n=1 Tax=Serpula lacrymans var. lacrymans (strain S7.9) TaxID=578457 RepID=F8P7T2_SERL9|nr:uncharacterized protein SERLADRAFT_441830 [Serpula lacrymans var. lacrymans S7.9]EGO20490.1 hypothetical protein SERLADRAFT_441830 [Serpula lacrymans var. lacrymans S7.9]